MRDDELEVAVKVVIVGNGAVGKSSMIQRYCRGTFTKEYKKTIGVDFLERMIEVYDDPVRLMLWDTAGQEEFDAITKAYYRGAQACVLTFSTVDRASFQAVRHWKKKVEDECGSIPMVLVQNKIDLIDRATIDAEEAEALARELKVRLYRTSVKEDLNVSQVFTYLAERYLAEMRTWEDDEFEPRTVITTNIFSSHGYKFHGKPGPYDSGIISLHPHGRRRFQKKRHLWKNICMA
ncbi:ras-related protein Rab-23-like [Pollicipes pollicipes]|uniref:ras-related protein Rab-23-like n=1 Tax=Pollicipes pollicipes TaxID=41117 RepID=UPI0018853487|nr:ras-related protein Rab-23-like [Pollicipes pollicipes]XP_037085889.1 ras-related protein Rab-23-like [Pollicipes pollicipes]